MRNISSNMRAALFIFSVFCASILHAQTDSVTKKFTPGFLIVGDYNVSGTDNVGFNGIHSPVDSVVSNGFTLRYVRFSANYQLNNKFSLGLLANLADFNADTKTKVLENAFVLYKHNKYLNVQLGQFRPYFGIEDRYPVEMHKSYYWSNQYGAFGRNNWMSFQVGIALFGSLEPKKIPLSYYFTVYNGNGKNMAVDNDNYKTFALRMEYEVIKKWMLGLNLARAGAKNGNYNALAIDLNTKNNLSDKWDVESESSFASGSNIRSFISSSVAEKRPEDYRMKGFYVLPLLRYKALKPNLYAIEFSTRYENFDENLKQGSNLRQTITPMLSFVFLEKNAAKLSLIGVIDNYKRNIPGTASYDQVQYMAQFQLKF